MSQQVSTKNTKSEILEAYEQLLDELKSTKKIDAKTRSTQEKAKSAVQAASELDSETVVKNLAGIKLKIGKQLDEISEQLVLESRKFKQIQQAIDVQKQNLREKYDINANADTLEALILAQQREKANFETAMTQKREQWAKEQKEAEQNHKEQVKLYEQLWQRKEEEYKYKTQRERRLDEDQYQHKKALLERELDEQRQKFNDEFATREQAITSSEAELAELRKKVAEFPVSLEEAIVNTEQKTAEQIELKYEYREKLRDQEMNAERKLHQQVVQSLESKIKEYETTISMLNDKANRSSSQVQEIAMKAIEGAAGRGVSAPVHTEGRRRDVDVMES